MLTLKDLIREIAKREGGKDVDSVGNIREIMRIIADICADNKEVLDVIYGYACRRAKGKSVSPKQELIKKDPKAIRKRAVSRKIKKAFIAKTVLKKAKK